MQLDFVDPGRMGGDMMHSTGQCGTALTTSDWHRQA
jgi:hypothetical protein